MVGPQRTVPSTSTAREDANAIPRPPNAWILFRAVKQKELLETRGKAPQAEVSKLISQMWKDAPEDVRAHYERLAEQKKAEHKLQHPTYRFQPKKKEEKEKLRQQKKLEKLRQASGSGAHTNPLPVVPDAPLVPLLPPQETQPPLIQPHPVSANAEVFYSLYTPRVSAEPSPSPPVSIDLSQRVCSASSYGGQSLDEPPSFECNDWQVAESIHQLLTPDSDITPLATTGNSWQDLPTETLQPPFDVPANTTQQLLTPPQAQDSQIPDAIQYEIPANMILGDFDILSPQAQNDAALADSLVFAFNYQLDNLPLDGALEVSMNPMFNESSDELFHGFDFSNLGLQYAADFSMLNTLSLDSIQPVLANQDDGLEEYVNFLDETSVPESAGLVMTPFITPPPENQPQVSQANISSTTNGYVQPSGGFNISSTTHGYVPPSGASSSSKRRVAATWKPAGFALDDSPVNNGAAPLFGLSAT